MSSIPWMHGRLIVLLLGALCAVPDVLRAADDTGLFDSKNDDSVTAALEAELTKTPDDFENLRLTDLSDVHLWQGVQPFNPASSAASNQVYTWKEARHDSLPPRVLVSPLGDQPATTVINVPEKAAYRVWLSYEADVGKPHPVTLTFSGASDQKHIYGVKALSSARGAEQEKELPIRFETEMQRISSCTKPTVIWEYAELPLNAGRTVLALTSRDPQALVDAVCITASKTFRPSKSYLAGDGTLHQTFYRVRVTQATQGGPRYAVASASLGYHWRRIPKGEDQPQWGSTLGSKDKDGFTSAQGAREVPVGEWTRWVDATCDVSDGDWARGGGPWATAYFGFSGVSAGTAEVQMAWFNHPAAVLRTVRTGIADGSACCLVPLEATPVPPAAGADDTNAVWGLRTAAVLDRFESAEDVTRRNLQWADEALAKLGVKPGQPTPKRITLYTGCEPAPAAREATQRMLSRLGLNSVGVTDPALLKELGERDHYFIGANDSQYLCHTHDPIDPVAERNFEASLKANAQRLEAASPGRHPQVTLKMGDEIGAVAGSASINGLETCRKAFHDYLRAELQRQRQDAAFFGVGNVDEIEYLEELPPHAGLFERRIYYHSQSFKFVLTAMYYGQCTRAAERVFPGAYTYCNFSPHPPMFGQQMNGSDWFALCREGGANTAWGEDWASAGGPGSWGFNGYEVVSYYGGWVACAARKRHNNAGFYVVCSMGAADKKIFSLIAQGIFDIDVYSFGPLYRGAEGSNFWSERQDAYAEIACAAYALGPADTIIVEGRREPRRTALLYNRSHEIWNGAYGGFQTDRLLTFAALSHAHIPTDIILEEDLTPETLAPYKVLYIQGFNLDPEQLDAVHKWVAAGGTLVGIAGTGIRDQYNSATDAAEKLFGARQQLVGVSEGSWHPGLLAKHTPIDRLTLTATDYTPAATVDVIGVKCVLTPTAGKSVGTFKDGACGAVEQTLGQGHTLLLGVMPGHIYKGSASGGSRYLLELRPLVTVPAETALGRERVEYSEPQTETCLFEHDSGLAVTLDNFAYFLEPKDRPTVLSVQTDRTVKEVVSTLRGALPWKREGDRIVINMQAPDPVDVVILR